MDYLADVVATVIVSILLLFSAGSFLAGYYIAPVTLADHTLCLLDLYEALI